MNEKEIHCISLRIYPQTLLGAPTQTGASHLKKKAKKEALLLRQNYYVLICMGVRDYIFNYKRPF